MILNLQKIVDLTKQINLTVYHIRNLKLKLLE